VIIFARAFSLLNIISAINLHTMVYDLTNGSIFHIRIDCDILESD